MPNDQQIAAIRAALAAIDTAIAQTEAALRRASTPDDILGLTSALVDLRAERARLQFQLANLEAASVEVQPLGATTKAAEITKLEKKLTAAVTDRAVVVAALKFATDVTKDAKTVRMIGDTTDRPKLPPKRLNVGDFSDRPKLPRGGLKGRK